MFKGKTRRGANWSWARLKESGYMRLHPNPRIRDVLVLNRSCRAAMIHCQGKAAHSPHEGLFRHDEILLRGILKTEDHGFLDHWRLEAELKVEGRNTFRISSAGHHIKYPDAVLSFRAHPEPVNVAVELELTLKDQKRYGQIVSSYSHMKDFDLVLFVAKDQSIVQAVKRAMEDAYYPASGVPLGFMQLKDWIANPLLGTLRINEESLTLASYVTQNERTDLDSFTSHALPAGK